MTSRRGRTSWDSSQTASRMRNGAAGSCRSLSVGVQRTHAAQRRLVSSAAGRHQHVSSASERGRAPLRSQGPGTHPLQARPGSLPLLVSRSTAAPSGLWAERGLGSGGRSAALPGSLRNDGMDSPCRGRSSQRRATARAALAIWPAAIPRRRATCSADRCQSGT